MGRERLRQLSRRPERLLAEPSFYDRFMHATYDNVRYATPAEHSQVQWRRWPN